MPSCAAQAQVVREAEKKADRELDVLLSDFSVLLDEVTIQQVAH